MATTIADTLYDPTGTPVVGVLVRATLVAASEVLTGGGAIIREAETTTASDGTWSLTLTPISSLAVSGGAYYLITADGHRWTVDVPDTGTHKLKDVQVEPDPLASLGLTTATGVALSIVDAKGDLLVGSAADAVARLAVGTDDYVLTADSTAPNGVKWATVTAGAAENGIPVGGTTGQLLRKSSATDFDAAWHTTTASDVGADAAGTAAGLIGALTPADIGAVPTTRTVNGHALSADVTVSKGDVGLGNVDNTSDTGKPISTATQTALDAKAPAADPTLTGTVTVSGRVVVTPDTLTDAATIATDASTGNHFRVTLTATGHVLGNPTNASDGQRILFELVQDATGSRAYTLGTKFNDPNGYFTGQSTAASKRDYLGVVYNAAADKFDVLAFSAGY